MTDLALKVSVQLAIASKFFKDSARFGKQFERAEAVFNEGRVAECESLLKQLPDAEKLLAELLEVLKEKPAYKGLKKLAENKSNNVWEVVKGLFSLGTHALIEIEKGNSEYRMLVQDVYERIGVLLYKGE